MGFIRPATPGFLVTLVATVLLAVVSFCVPYFKSVYFLKANISVSGVNGSITFGTLGYCLELTNGTSCSKPSVGYQLDINGLVGNQLPVQIPQVAVKWITYALVLHIVALALAAASAVFGLLAHVREMSMTCCSSFISGFAASVALIAFIFDIALFFIAKARINAVGTAVIGSAVWLTLAAWILLFFSGCFFTLGRCCISRRKARHGSDWNPVHSSEHTGADPMRLDAVKAEADRKARQKASEGGLPAFHEVQPLTARIEGDKVVIDGPYKDAELSNAGPARQGHSASGYVQAPAGTRAVDEYYSPTRTEQAPSTYPPAPQQQLQNTGYVPSSSYQNYEQTYANHLQRQGSGYAQSQYATSTYQHNAAHNQQSSTAREYGHAAGGSSYHTAVSHDQYPSSYSQYDAYDTRQHPNDTAYAPSYHTTPSLGQSVAASTSYHANQGYHQPERSYTLGGGGYGDNVLPPPPEHSTAYYTPQQIRSPPIDTSNGYLAPPSQTSPVKGPRAPSFTVRNDDLPPTYEGSSSIQGAWGKH